MTTKLEDSLGSQAAEIAMAGAAALLRTRGVRAEQVDLDAMTAAIRTHAVAALPLALADARQAADAILGRAGEQIAVQTFAASMRLAGIAAAKEVLGC